MAKRNKRGKGNGSDKILDVLGALVGGVLGDALSDTIGTYFSDDKRTKKRSKKNADQEKADDVAAKILRILADDGPKSVSELLQATDLGLTPLLRALNDTRNFKLVEFVGEDDVIQLTQSGQRTATVLRKNGMRKEADLMLSR